MNITTHSLYELAGTVLAVVALIGMVVGLGKWIFNRGGQERGTKAALEANTEATKELTGSMKHVVETVNTHTVQLAVHDQRLNTLEATPHVAVNVAQPSNRDSGSSG